jgi:Glycosyl transferase family 8
MATNDQNKIVYVLVSDELDHYTEMAILSIACARKYSPKLMIELVVDRKTYDGLHGFRKTIIDSVDRLQVVDVHGKNNAFTSRMIKTQLRSFIKGDYLYVDIDAIPIADLSSVFGCDEDIAMVYDHNLPPEKFIFYDYEREIFDKMHWPLPKKYFNSGVMFVKDTSKVRDFFVLWHSLWQQNSALGLHKDQPPMHEAIRQADINVKGLSPEWNMLIGLQKGYGGKSPKVYHYSTIRFETRSDTHFHAIVKGMKNGSSINWELMDKIIVNKFPWTNTNSLRLNWAVGNYAAIPSLILKKVIGR